MLGFEPANGASAPPQTLLRKASVDAIDAAWAAADAELLLERTSPDRQRVMAVSGHREHGYLVDAPGHGRFRISPDGSLVECAPDRASGWRWQRPLFAQALPIAAALAGVEVLHASGVLIDGRAVAFCGHSGSGKTSLAFHLVDQGASLLADDVVALSCGESGLYAHPGVRLANVAREQFEAVPPKRRERLGEVVGRTDKLHILIEALSTARAPLDALFFLERGPSIARLEFELIAAPKPEQLLGATFVSHVTSPARMMAQLEVCAAIAAQVAVYRLRVPPGVGASALARAVRAHRATVPA